MSWLYSALEAFGRIIAMFFRRLRDFAIWSVQNSRNFGISLFLVFIVALAIKPDLGPKIGQRIGDGITGLIGAILNALAPLVEPTLTLAIIGFGFWLLLKAFRRG